LPRAMVSMMRRARFVADYVLTCVVPVLSSTQASAPDHWDYPGPGRYEPGPGGHIRSCPQTPFGGGHGKNRPGHGWVSTSPGEPAPNAYRQEISCGKQVLSGRATSPSSSFSKTARFGSPRNTVPGPPAYRPLASNRGHTAIGSPSSRRLSQSGSPAFSMPSRPSYTGKNEFTGWTNSNPPSRPTSNIRTRRACAPTPRSRRTYAPARANPEHLRAETSMNTTIPMNMTLPFIDNLRTSFGSSPTNSPPLSPALTKPRTTAHSTVAEEEARFGMAEPANPFGREHRRAQQMSEQRKMLNNNMDLYGNPNGRSPSSPDGSQPPDGGSIGFRMSMGSRGGASPEEVDAEHFAGQATDQAEGTPWTRLQFDQPHPPPTAQSSPRDSTGSLTRRTMPPRQRLGQVQEEPEQLESASQGQAAGTQPDSPTSTMSNGHSTGLSEDQLRLIYGDTAEANGASQGDATERSRAPAAATPSRGGLALQPRW
jgi:hypothetical protein